jgi:translation initiation factor 2 subunit 2
MCYDNAKEINFKYIWNNEKKFLKIQNVESNNFSKYKSLLNRLFEILNEKNVNFVFKDKTIIQIPKIAREGTKKTLFLNFQEICLKLHRNNDHVLIYISTELGTTASIQEGGRLVLRGKFNQKGIEHVLRNYISEYVLCGSCKSVDTYFKKGEINKLFFLKCNLCKASRFVNPIKAGFVAQTKRKKNR